MVGSVRKLYDKRILRAPRRILTSGADDGFHVQDLSKLSRRLNVLCRSGDAISIVSSLDV